MKIPAEPRKCGVYLLFFVTLLFFSSCSGNGLEYLRDHYGTNPVEQQALQDSASGEYTKAIDEYTTVINLNPKDGMAYLGRGSAYQQLGNYRRAIDDFNRAAEYLPNDSIVFLVRGIAYSMAGNNDRAIEDYTRSVELNPMNSDAYYNRADAYAKSGKETNALEDLKRSAHLGNTDARNMLQSRGMSW
jgi:tetratricopeptide (TPR) repeat protein